MHNLDNALGTACIYVLRYVRGTPNLGLVYNPGEDLKIEAYSDSTGRRNNQTENKSFGNVLW